MSIFSELTEHALLPFAQARMLPAAAYTSDEVLAQEHRRIFSHEWSCIGRTADMPSSFEDAPTAFEDSPGSFEESPHPLKSRPSRMKAAPH